MNRALWLIGGLGLGAGLMYVLDPERGERRRALARAQIEPYRRWTDDLLGQTRRTLGQQTHTLSQQARGFGQQARTLGQQAREFLAQVRLPLRYEREPVDSTKGLLMLGCMGLGVGLMYMLDPSNGRRRRALVRDKASSYWRQTGDLLSKTARDASNRTRGFVSEARTRLTGGADESDDAVLEARVRAQIGHVVLHAGAIGVTAHQGRVTLRGPVSASEADKLLSTVAAVSGVTEVVNQLQVRSETEHASGVQGGDTFA